MTSEGDAGAARKEQEYALVLNKPLAVLTIRQIQLIDQALASLGPFSEVRLIKVRGKLRFIEKLESESALEPTETSVSQE
ncbi:MAG: hypothetical protein ACUVSF_01255 [Anaerolineae bacterium]